MNYLIPETRQRLQVGQAFTLGEWQFPANWLELSTDQEKVEHGIYPLVTAPAPVFESMRQSCDVGPAELVAGVWTQTWVVTDLGVDAVTANTTAATVALEAAIIEGMTQLFMTTAQSRHYDSHITCAMRAGYPGPFHDEGVAFATWMDAQNALAYSMLAEVQAGRMAMPATVEAALALLEPMVWPT